MKLFNRSPETKPANRFESITDKELIAAAYSWIRDALHREITANENFKRENGRDNIIAKANIETYTKQLTELRYALND